MLLALANDESHSKGFLPKERISLTKKDYHPVNVRTFVGSKQKSISKY